MHATNEKLRHGVKGPPFSSCGWERGGQGGVIFQVVFGVERAGAWMLPNSMVGITKCNFSPYWWKALPYIQACLAKGHFAKQKTHPQGYHNICFLDIELVFVAVMSVK